ncbi:transglycosylase SLT domain-containing protein [Streptomyces sp. NPDC005962]|uniref:transglycosylase SLT domain-containing protein n=1 Tax=Streptomyces sp. NPDC005962 TaxID=3154466 RepID=UPI0033EDFF2A
MVRRAATGIGDLCSQIGPVVIASQIQQESGWNKELVGINGAEGISQVPPDTFKKWGEDENDNDKTSGLTRSWTPIRSTATLST